MADNWIHKGDWTKQLTLQPGSRMRDTKQGATELTRTFWCPFDKAKEWGPKIGQADKQYTNLLADTVEVEEREGNLGVITVVFKGLAQGEKTELPAPTRRRSRSVSQEPIQTHPKFISGEIAGTSKADRKNGAIWELRDPTKPAGDDNKEEFKGFEFGSRFYGVEYYEATRVIYSRTFASYADINSSGVGDIATPSGAPPLGGKRNWKFQNEDSELQGGYFLITQTYMGSGPGGWDSIIYS